jgi:Cd2+/Zn2+-exporting ATPase
LTLAPEKALVDDGSGKLVETRAAEIPLGSRIRVRPGEKLALDGVVTEGSSAIDQSPITGESVPVQKFAGDQVFAGTLNVSGVLDYEVTVPYGDSALARIVKTVEAAERAKAPVERFVERFARIYTPAVFVLAILAAVLPPLLIGGEWRSWIYRALALLVISCPCALVVSTPVALLSAMASATRRGLLIKGGVHLEEGRRLAVVAMDKTGTLTSGRPSRTDISALGGFEPAEADRLSASLASLSNHPVSKAVVKASAFKDGELAALTGFRDIPGLGIEAELGERKLALGDSRLAKELGALDEALEAAVRRLESEGKTATILVVDGKAAALLATADTIKEDSRRAVSELKALGVRTVMLTGDNELTAAAVAAQVGVDSFRARLMPEEKLAVIEELGSKVKVGMAGDGINDAPALARADVGFSMGAAGTGTAIETADVAIMDDNLAKIPLFIRLSRAVHRVLTGNIVFIMAVKLSFITVTLMGRADMWMAVLADIGVTLIVVANSMRLSRS